MTRALAIWLVSLVLTAAVVCVCYLWLDRPIALWVHHTFDGLHVPRPVVDSRASSTAFLSAWVFIIMGLVAMARGRFSTVGTTVTLCVISTVSTVLVKDQLKFIFGRTWPDSWRPDILSFLKNGVYGFHYFHYGQSFESFPSGHAAAAAALLSVPWILLPKLRVLATILILTIDVGLLILNLHFLSDVIAGTFLGFSMGLFTVSMWRACGAKVGS